MHILIRLSRALPLLFSLAAVPAASPQPAFLPRSASTRLYFAQLADGGPALQKWTTTLELANPNATDAAVVSVGFYGDNGQAWLLDFGQGYTSTLTVNLPAGGTATFTTTGASGSVTVGWALASSNVPVMGTVIYRASKNGAPQMDVAAEGTGPTFQFSSFANYDLGIALVHFGPQVNQLRITASDQSGRVLAVGTLDMAPSTHTAFNLGLWFRTTAGVELGAGFHGRVTIASANNPPSPFVALTLNSRYDLLSPLPAGEMQSPPPHERRLLDVFARMMSTVAPLAAETAGSSKASQVVEVFGQMGVAVDGNLTVAASFGSADKKVHVSQAMLEALGSSDAALGFLIMRTAFRGFQSLTGAPPDLGLDTSDLETAAESWAALSLVKAGFDPGGAADCMARVSYASASGVPVAPEMMTAFGNSDAANARLRAVSAYVQQACNLSLTMTQTCQMARQLWHPHYPSQVP
jgi:hypothetical protein